MSQKYKKVQTNNSKKHSQHNIAMLTLSYTTAEPWLKTALCKEHSGRSLSKRTSQVHIKTYSDSLQQKYSSNDTFSNHNHLQQGRVGGNNKL